MKRFGTVLVLLVLIVLPVFTLGAPKRGEIIRADYGSGNRWVDVTQRVRSFIRGDALDFRVDNATLGADPAPGRAKVLRLQVREKNGKTRRLTFQENEYVSLRGYSGGNTAYGSDLQILRGDYGAGNRVVDVTNRLNSQIRSGQLNIQVTNNNMGGDPAPGNRKTLRVLYSYNGRQSEVVVNEGDDLRLPGGNTAYGSDLQILRGDYGAGNRVVDVTNRLNSQIRSGQLNIQVTNNNMGGDPAPGNRKTLRVLYSYNGRQSEVVVNEGDDLRLPGGMGTVGAYGIIPSGTQLSIRTNEAIDSKTATAGQQFSAVMAGDVLNSSGAVAIPKGSDVALVIRRATESDLVLDIDSLVVAGQRYVVSTADLEQKGRQGIGANKRTAEMVGGGAALGALIGAIVGGGKGAAIGAGIGAAGGAGAVVLTKGKEVRVPAETVLNFKLDTDLRLEPAFR
jgi:hypothetical protein